MGLKGVILLGDPTSSGGRIISASGFMTVNDKLVACVGDKATCPVDGHGDIATIIEGSSSDTMGGKPFAYDGCALSCGCRAIATTTTFMLEPNRDMKAPMKAKSGAVSATAAKPISRAVVRKQVVMPAISKEDSRPVVTPISKEEVKKRFDEAYKKWWKSRSKQFRTWGPISNSVGWWTGKPNPVCVDYAEAAANSMNADVKIPGAGAYPKWDTEVPTDTLGKFDKKAPAGSHCNVHVYMTDQDGKIVEVESFDPWWKL